MKILILLMFLVSCTTCEERKPHRAYKYGDKVSVTNGFFKGQTGTIVSKRIIRNDKTRCYNVPAFIVKLDSTGETFSISQYFLYVDGE